MNYREVKYFSGTKDSREYESLNPDMPADFSLYKLGYATLDFDMIVSFRDHIEQPDVTVIEMRGSGNTYLLPMSYANFKNFYNKCLLCHT